MESDNTELVINQDGKDFFIFTFFAVVMFILSSNFLLNIISILLFIFFYYFLSLYSKINIIIRRLGVSFFECIFLIFLIECVFFISSRVENTTTFISMLFPLSFLVYLIFRKRNVESIEIPNILKIVIYITLGIVMLFMYAFMDMSHSGIMML